MHILKHANPQNVLFNSALKQSSSLRKDLDTFSQDPSAASAALQGQISTSITTLSRTLTDYENLSRNELNAEKKEKAGERLKNFKADLTSYRAQFEELKKEKEAQGYVEARGELLGHRRGYTAGGGGNIGGGVTPENPYAHASSSSSSAFAPAHRNTQDGLSFGGSSQQQQQQYTREEHALREANFFDSANAQIDEFLDRGRAVLGDLGQQREILKGTQRKLYSVANTLGVSGDTIRMVERRAKQDKWIFWAGAGVFFVFCFLVIYYLR